MCWLYYKFERVVSRLGQADIPKILYEGEVSSYELILLSILSNVGCDVVLLQYHGDEPYLKIDKMSFYSDKWILSDAKAFPEHFSLKQLRETIKQAERKEWVHGKIPTNRSERKE